MNTTINERVLLLIQALDKKPSNFAESIDKTSTAIYTIVNGRNKPGYDILEAIMRVYPEVNPDWLFSGSGEIFRLAQKSVDGGAFGEQVIKGLDSIKHVFEEELKAKNHQIEAKDSQIASLQEMLKMALVGKPNDVAAGRSVIRIHPATQQLMEQVAASV